MGSFVLRSQKFSLNQVCLLGALVCLTIGNVASPQFSWAQIPVANKQVSQNQVVMLKNGNLFQGSVTRQGGFVQVVVDKKTSLIFKSSKVAVVAKSVDELYEIRSLRLSPSDLKGRNALLQWCLREKFFPQASKEIERIARYTIVRKSDLDQMKNRLVSSRQIHLQTLEIARKREAEKARRRQAARQNGQIQQMSFQTDSKRNFNEKVNKGSPKGASKKQQAPVIPSVFSIYDGTPKEKGKSGLATPGSGTSSSSKKKAAGKLGSHFGFHSKKEKDGQGSSLFSPLKKIQGGKKVKLKDNKAKNQTSATQSEFTSQMRPTPDPNRPYDPAVFNRFYHPEKFATSRKSRPVSTAGLALPADSAQGTRPALFRNASMFQSKTVSGTESKTPINRAEK